MENDSNVMEFAKKVEFMVLSFKKNIAWSYSVDVLIQNMEISLNFLQEF